MTVRATWLLAALTAVALIAIVIVRQPLVAFLFERGKFGESSTSAVALILLTYAPAMFGRVIADFLARLLFAMDKMRMPAVSAVVAVVINLVICVLLPSTWPELIGLGGMLGFFLGAFLLVRYVGELHRNA
jgi:putative peptidoglycan lipid II flippase